MKMANSWKAISGLVLDNGFFDVAYDLDYLDRYTGEYLNMEGRGFTVNQVDNLSLLELKGSKPIYLARKKGTDEFVSSYFIENNKKSFYQDKDKFQVIFNVEQGTLVLKYTDGKEYTYTRKY